MAHGSIGYFIGFGVKHMGTEAISGVAGSSQVWVS